MKKKQTGGNNDQTKIYYDLKFKLYEKLESHIGGFNKQFDKIYLELNKLKNNKNIFSKNNNVEQNKYNNNFDTLAEITEIKH